LTLFLVNVRLPTDVNHYFMLAVMGGKYLLAVMY